LQGKRGFAAIYLAMHIWKIYRSGAFSIAEERDILEMTTTYRIGSTARLAKRVLLSTLLAVGSVTAVSSPAWAEFCKPDSAKMRLTIDAGQFGQTIMDFKCSGMNYFHNPSPTAGTKGYPVFSLSSGDWSGWMKLWKDGREHYYEFCDRQNIGLTGEYILALRVSPIREPWC
jgi:hypothetical protein